MAVGDQLHNNAALPRGKNLGAHWIGGCVGSTAGRLNCLRKKKTLAANGILDSVLWPYANTPSKLANEFLWTHNKLALTEQDINDTRFVRELTLQWEIMPHAFYLELLTGLPPPTGYGDTQMPSC
jgi:hypothetical protein